MEKKPKVVILCGGKGTRAFPFTEYLPKPMMPIGGSPIIVQLIKSFIHQGYKDFVLASGYRYSVLEDYFDGKDLGANIEILFTGEEANTGERIYKCRDVVGDTFIATYADGLCDIRFSNLLDFHSSHPGLATLVSMPMYSQYGVLTLDNSGQVKRFREKPLINEHWINAGFVVFDKKIFDYWEGNDLEREVFPNLIERDLVYAYRHNGFFKSMDNYKDSLEFEAIIKKGNVPWLAPDLIE